MARPATYDRDQALQQATAVFWRQGFLGTSIRDLSFATGLNPGSLYGAFDSKRGIFLAALETYFTELRVQVNGILGADGPPLTRVHKFFEELIKDAASDPEARGCLLVNTLLETPTRDDEINRRLNEMFEDIEAQFAAVLEEARRQGSLRSDSEPQALARFLVTVVYGLRVYNRRHPGLARLREIAKQSLAALR